TFSPTCGPDFNSAAKALPANRTRATAAIRFFITKPPMRHGRESRLTPANRLSDEQRGHSCINLRSQTSRDDIRIQGHSARIKPKVDTTSDQRSLAGDYSKKNGIRNLHFLAVAVRAGRSAEAWLQGPSRQMPTLPSRSSIPG